MAFFDNGFYPQQVRFRTKLRIIKKVTKIERLNDSVKKDVRLIKEKSPLIHNITNYVVMNNTANALLAIGASPVMAHAAEEVEDMVGIASALVINIGTLDKQWVQSMLIAGSCAARLGIPVILDPVGAGATPYRTAVAKEIISVCQPTVIRGNGSEILALIDANIQTKGVDSTSESHMAVNAAKQLAKQTGAIISVSGEIDYITDGVLVNEVKGGDPMMARITGMGCTATALTAAFVAVNKDYLQAATNAMELMSRVGEAALSSAKGPASLQQNFIDKLYNI